MSTSDIVDELCGPKDYSPSGVIGIGFDVETTGGCMTKNAMTEFGAVAIAIEDCDKRRVLARFEGHMMIPEGCGFEEKCEKEFWNVHKVQEKIQVLACRQDPADVMRAFVAWVFKIRDTYAGGEARRVRFITDAAYFDAAWMSHYLTKYADHDPMHTFFSDATKSRFKPVIDTNAFFRGVANIGLRLEFDEELLYSRFSCGKAVRLALSVPDDEKPDTPHDHRAVNDAQNIIEEYLIILRYMYCKT